LLIIAKTTGVQTLVINGDSNTRVIISCIFIEIDCTPWRSYRTLGMGGDDEFTKIASS